MRRKLFGTRRRVVASVAVLALVVTGVGVAAFILYSGANGSGSGTFAGGTNTPAITITGTSSPVLDTTATVDLAVSVTNNDPDAAHQLVNLDGTTFSTTPAQCANYIAIGSASIIGNYAAGETRSGTVTIGTLPGIPPTCAGGSWTINFQGVTNP